MHNVGQGWPYYAEHLWAATQDNGLAAVLYAASEVEARVGDGTKVRIVEETKYPFDETVDFIIQTRKRVEFPLFLRIPEWCEGARLSINGRADEIRPKPLKYVLVERDWHEADRVRLELPMRIRLTVWPRNKNSVSVHRGPLTYSLQIGERWVRCGGTDDWPAYEVYPATPWNYGLTVDRQNPERSFEIFKRGMPTDGQPFTSEDAPARLAARGERMPQWRQEENGLVGPLPEGPSVSSEPVETIWLIPTGCARLRISSFPVVG